MTGRTHDLADEAYGNLLQSLRKDLQLDASTDLLPGSLQAALQGPGSAGGYLFQPARMYRTAALNAGTANTPLTLALDTIAYDLTNGAMSVANAGFKCPAAGYYLCINQYAFNPASDGWNVIIGIGLNGTITHWTGGDNSGTAASINLFVSGSTILPCAAGDIITSIYQTNLAGIAFEVAGSVNYLEVMRVA